MKKLRKLSSELINILNITEYYWKPITDTEIIEVLAAVWYYMHNNYIWCSWSLSSSLQLLCKHNWFLRYFNMFIHYTCLLEYNMFQLATENVVVLEIYWGWVDVLGNSCERLYSVNETNDSPKSFTCFSLLISSMVSDLLPIWN